MGDNQTIQRTAPQKYDPFWHLQAIGLLKLTPPPLNPAEERIPTDVWGSLEGAPSATVAIIDTGVCCLHPYMKGKVPALGDASYDGNVDLTAMPALSRPVGAAGALDGLNEKLLRDLGLYSAPKATKHGDWLLEQVTQNSGKQTLDVGTPLSANQKFSAHGTSCAGLVAASSEVSEKDPLIRPYYRGVDPDSKILSITTSFAPRPEMLTLAFLLAASRKVDVILFPRGLPREILGKDETLEPKWRGLKETIISVSKKIPVVCAAGNESDKKLIAPARFAASDNGIIAVAAMNYFGVRSSYSNFGAGTAVAAPSDDAEIFNRDQARLDKTDRYYSDYPYQVFIENFKLPDVDYGKASIKAIDIPGAFGFSDSDDNTVAHLLTSPESFFTDFGGTSAAASIVAGVASLMQRAAKKKSRGTALDGIQIRQLIKDTAHKTKLPHFPGATDTEQKRKLDRVNGKAPDALDAYGNGLVAADRAVNQILYGNPEGPSV